MLYREDGKIPTITTAFAEANIRTPGESPDLCRLRNLAGREVPVIGIMMKRAEVVPRGCVNLSLFFF
jgi:hypothetical protein